MDTESDSHLSKEPGYDEWFRAKVTRTLEKMAQGKTSYTDHAVVARESLEWLETEAKKRKKT